MLESEYSYLIKSLPSDLENFPKKEIKQGYFSSKPAALRIRKQNDVYILNKKIALDPTDFSRHEESEITIKAEEFELLWPLCKTSLTKTRYYYPLSNNLTAEVDVYHGPLEGLATVEVEFASEEVRSVFEKPDWFGQDVTQADWAANSELCNLTYDEVKELIKSTDQGE